MLANQLKKLPILLKLYFQLTNHPLVGFFMNHFYIHIPFCNQKCPYCKFALTPIFNATKKRRYLAFLKNEITNFFKKNTHISIDKKTIYFWWWTPSILQKNEIVDILNCFPFYKNNSSKIEISFECNPEDVNESYAKNLFEIGINRISIGIQSLNNTTLKAVHRSDSDSIFSALKSIEKNIPKWVSLNIDCILWLPYTKSGEILKNLKTLHSQFSKITHTSIYLLENELYPKNWKQNSINENQMQEEFIEIMNFFQKKWWNHYEISNFCKPWYECKHNQSYWTHTNNKWFWLAAASFIDMKRYNNSQHFHWYYQNTIENFEILNPYSLNIEKMMFGLRTFHWTEYKNPIFNQEKIQKFIQEGYLKYNWIKILPTQKWIFILDHIMSEILL